MDRLQKKCFIATSTFHGVLVGVLLFGSALMPEHKEENNAKILTAIDPSKVSEALSNGGEPDVKVPPAAQPAQPIKQETLPTPPPQPKALQPPPKTEPPKVEPKTEPLPKIEPPKIIHPTVRSDIPKIHDEKIVKTKPKPDAKELTPVTQKAPHKVIIDPRSTQLVMRKGDEKARAEREAAEAEAREQQRRRSGEVTSSLRSLNKNLSSRVVIEENPGVGGGGPLSVNYIDLIHSVYFAAWSAPLDTDDTTLVKARITIARDGSVVSARIMNPSGNRSLDRSIQNALDAVKFIGPFPESNKEPQKTVILPFSLEAKRQTG